MLGWIWLFVLGGCVTADPPPPVPVPPAPPSATPGADAAVGADDAAAPPERAGRAGRSVTPPMPALGVAGPGTIHVQIAVSGEPSATTGTVAFTFADGSTKQVSIDPVPGKCAEVPVKPVTSNGRTVTPLYSYDCEFRGRMVSVHVAQAEGHLLFVSVEPSRTGTPKLRMLKRIPLAEGLVLSRKA